MKGQVSIEYLMVIGFVIALLIPTIIISFEFYTDFKDVIQSRQAEQSAYALVKEAESIFFLGPPSISTIDIYLPDNIISSTITSDTIIFRLQTGRGVDDVVAYSQVNLTGAIPITQGTHRIRIEAQDYEVAFS